MKLPDFSYDDVFKNLKKTMGVVKDVEWEAGNTWKGISREEMRMLAGRGVDVDLKQIAIASDGTFEYKGLKVLLYIRDQQPNQDGTPKDYKYHVGNCSTLQSMRDQHRYERYVVTNNSSGDFFVNLINYGRSVGKALTLRLNVCRNCLTKLDFDGYASRGSKDLVYRKFTLPEFFRRYQHTSFPSLPERTPESQPLNEYTADWNEISLRVRRLKKFKCEGERCRRRYTKNQLDVHHIDGQKWNNRPSNLMVLCLDCHGRFHPHYDPKWR